MLIHPPFTHKLLVRPSASIIFVLPGRASAAFCNRLKTRSYYTTVFSWYLMIIAEMSVTRIPAIRMCPSQIQTSQTATAGPLRNGLTRSGIYSIHKDKDQIFEYLKRMSPKPTVVIVVTQKYHASKKSIFSSKI